MWGLLYFPYAMTAYGKPAQQTTLATKLYQAS